MGKKRRILIDFFRRIGIMPIVSKISNIRYKILKKYFKLKGLNALDAVYNDNFFNEINIVDEQTKSSKIVADYIINEFSPKSVIDLGCGTGVYIKKLEDKGIEVLGIEGSKNALKFSKIESSKILIEDVTKPIFLDKKFDIVICFEVAEHVHEKYSENLVSNLTRLGNTILFTAAPPNQGGTDHINEKPKNYWIKIFENHGFIYDNEGTLKMKDYLEKEKCVWWIPKNIFVFKKFHRS